MLYVEYHMIWASVRQLALVSDNKNACILDSACISEVQLGYL